MEVFEFFAERQEQCTVNDVSRGLGYPQSSTSQLLHSLTETGYLNYNRKTRMFHPTLRIATTAAWLADPDDGEGDPLRAMRRLAAETGQTVILATQREVSLMYLHVLQPKDTIAYMKPGMLRPLCVTAAGRALLGLRPEKYVRSLVRQVNACRSASDTLIDSDELLDRLAMDRSRGYAVSSGTISPTVGVASVIPARAGQPPMALALGAPADPARRPEQWLAEHLIDAVRRLTRSANGPGSASLEPAA